MKQRVFDAGYTMPVVAARGPLCTASFFRGVTQLMMDLIDEPERALKLIDLCTTLTIDWLKAQAAAIGPSVEGILVLDDIVGLIGPDALRAIRPSVPQAHLRRLPADWVKVYHNDASVEACLERLPDAGFDVLNWGKQTESPTPARGVGGRMTLMGNVPPLDIGVRGTPEQVEASHPGRPAQGGRASADSIRRRRREPRHARRQHPRHGPCAKSVATA